MTISRRDAKLSSMRIIKAPFLAAAAKDFPKARKWLEQWGAIVAAVEWRHLQDVRAVYPSADAVKVASGRKVTVFNACHNDYRLIVAIHYNRRIVYTLGFLTHAEYSKDKWKEEL